MARLPIVTYDDPLLRQVCKPVDLQNPDLDQLIENMFETMYEAQGVGLAAPQVGELIQLFVMDADPLTEEVEEPDYGPMVFINPKMIETGGDQVELEEGCLSIPEVRDKVKRPDLVEISWTDRALKNRKATFNGWTSRVIQHEFDHLMGKLFLDYLSSFRKRLHRSRLRKIDAGSIQADYLLAKKS